MPVGAYPSGRPWDTICGCPIHARVRTVEATLVVARYEAWNFGGISYFLPALMQVLLYLAAKFNYFLARE